MRHNRHHDSIQAAIGALGDHIGSEQKLVRMLADLRAIEDESIPKFGAEITKLLKNAAKIANVPESEILNATYQDVEGGRE